MTDWSSIYGTGKGSAYVIQGNPALTELKQNYADQQKANAKEDAAFSANLAKLNFKGARDADAPIINKNFADILATHQKLRATNDPTERQALQLSLQQKQQGLLYDINQSVQHNQHENKLVDLRLNPNANLSDDYYKTVGGLQQMPSIGDNYNNYQQALQGGMQNIFAPTFDASKFEGNVVKQSLVPIDKYGQLVTKKLDNGATMTQEEAGQNVDLNKTFSLLKSDYLANPKSGLKSFINRQAQANNTDAGDELMKYANDIVQRHQPNYGSKLIAPKGHIVEPSKPDKFYEHYNYQLAHPKAVVGNSPTPLPSVPIPYGEDGKATVHAKNFVAISLPNKNFAGSPAIDMGTGKSVKSLAPSGDFSIVGAGDYPVVKAGTTYGGSLAQPDFEKASPNLVEHKRMIQVQQKAPITGALRNYLIPYDKFPANIANQKDVKKALGGLNGTAVYRGGLQLPAVKGVHSNIKIPSGRLY